jgi:hypothetical protein
VTTERDFEQQARAALEASVEPLDARVRSRLTQARHAALDELQRRSRRSAWLIARAMGFAAAAVVAVVLWTSGPAVQDPLNGAALTAQAVAPTDELDFLLGEDVYAVVFEEPAG